MLFTRLQFTSKVALGVHSLGLFWTSLYSFAQHTQTQLFLATFLAILMSQSTVQCFPVSFARCFESELLPNVTHDEPENASLCYRQ